LGGADREDADMPPVVGERQNEPAVVRAGSRTARDVLVERRSEPRDAGIVLDDVSTLDGVGRAIEPYQRLLVAKPVVARMRTADVDECHVPLRGREARHVDPRASGQEAIVAAAARVAVDRVKSRIRGSHGCEGLSSPLLAAAGRIPPHGASRSLRMARGRYHRAGRYAPCMNQLTARADPNPRGVCLAVQG